MNTFIGDVSFARKVVDQSYAESPELFLPHQFDEGYISMA